MSLIALDGMPLVQIGAFLPLGINGTYATSSITQDAAKEATIMYGHVITDDGGSHTLDTSGSSSLQWRTGACTFANAGTTFKVGLATMDTGTGPPGRATNSTDTITFSVSKSMTGGGGGVTTNAWQTHVPDSGSLAVANGDFIAFCTQMTALGGSDSVLTSFLTLAGSPGRPSITSFTGAAYAAVSGVPNVVIVFSDGHLGWFWGGNVFTTNTTQTWNSGSATKEYGNFLQFPFPVKVYGIYTEFALGGDCDFVLYSDPLGTPMAEKTVSADANAVAAATVRPQYYLFSSPYSAYANQPLAVIAKPGGTNVSMTFKSLNASAHQVTDNNGTNGYAVNRASGAFAAQNSNKDRFPIGALVGAYGGFTRSTGFAGF